MGDVGGGQAAPYIARVHGAALERSQLFAHHFRCVLEGQTAVRVSGRVGVGRGRHVVRRCRWRAGSSMSVCLHLELQSRARSLGEFFGGGTDFAVAELSAIGEGLGDC